jgi:hypothetical protein
MGKFLGMQFQRRLSRRAMLAPVRDFGQPAPSDFIEMLERPEGAAIQKVPLDVLKGAFHFTFGLRPAYLASPWLEAIMRGE